ncbi:glycosyltransferase involved in cell wall biosynthesis [Cellulomonas sp. PhB150]|nr:glycosyltransferase involved in cell wall biosynthesis [Cellulomonas sp. PhB150]
MTQVSPTGAATADPALRGARVTVVGINYAPESTGIAPYTTAMARALRDAGALVRVVTGVPHYPQWEVTDPRYRSGRRWHENVDGIDVLRVAHHVPPTADLGGRARMEATFLRNALPAVRGSGADAVVAVTPSLAGLAAGVLGSRGAPLGVVVQDLTGAGAGESGTTGRAAARAITSGELWGLRRARLVGVIAPRFGELLVEAGVDADRVVDVPNFTHITASTATRDEARQVLGWSTDEVIALHTGNMGMKQGLEVLVDAGRLAGEDGGCVRVVLVGDGNQRDRLVQLAHGLARVTILEPLDDERYGLALAAADVLLLNEKPGVREMSLPSKLTSYVATGRPIVAAVEPGGISHALLTQHGAAELVGAGDAAGVLAAVHRVSSDPARAGALVAAGSRMGAALWSAPAAEARYRAFVARLLDA